MVLGKPEGPFGTLNKSIHILLPDALATTAASTSLLVLLPLRQLAIRRLDLLDRSIPRRDPLGTCRVRIQQAGLGTA